VEWSEVIPLADAHFPEAPGLYRLFLQRAGALSGTILDQEPEGALLYIGKAEEDGLRCRHEEQHLGEDSGWSTFRRSLGAVLREKLGLKPVPRRRGPHMDNYSFSLDGEHQLTKWMLQNLAVSWATPGPTVDLAAEEKCLIEDLQPALNITHNRKGKYVPALKRLRKVCRDEVRSSL
jgi:hypothetical protein